MNVTMATAVGSFLALLGAAIVVAWLAFTLAITFNMAHGKHHDRKELVREDAKAIRTAYDRALLLPPEAAAVAHAKLAEYATIRAFDTFTHPDTELAVVIARSEEIQGELWMQALERRTHPQVRFYSSRVLRRAVHGGRPRPAAARHSSGRPRPDDSTRRRAVEPARRSLVVQPSLRARRSHAWSDLAGERTDRNTRSRRDPSPRPRP